MAASVVVMFAGPKDRRPVAIYPVYWLFPGIEASGWGGSGQE